MISTGDIRLGEIVYRKLLAAGGFVWDHRRIEGVEKISVHMNRGCVMDDELRHDLKCNGVQLKAYVFAMHDEQAKELAAIEGRASGFGRNSRAARLRGCPGEGSFEPSVLAYRNPGGDV